MSADLDAIKDRLTAEVDARAELLLDVSHQIHARPELCFEERFAHDLLTTVLADAGLAVEPHAFGLATAFVARAGHEGPTIAVLCEYDALPGIGHACGHNIIAAAGLGAGLAAATVAEELGGRLVVLGTPAEEGGGGKVIMIEAGALEDVDAAMMVHPASADAARLDAIAIDQYRVTYRGRAAHAAAFPWEGLNALDAAVLGYLNAAALRQHIRPDERIHGIFTRAGDKPNIVPSEAEAIWYVRSPRRSSLERLVPRVLACLEAGASAAGCEIEWERTAPVYDELRDNDPLLDAFRTNAARRGRQVPPLRPRAAQPIVGSTDMGNVSQVVPAIHPLLKVAPTDVPIHSPDFAQYAASEAGDAAVLDGAAAMAMTVADLWTQPDLLDGAATAFRGAERD